MYFRRHFLVLAFAGLLITPAMGQGLPPVVAAAKEADWDLLATLLQDSGNPNAAWGDGTTALHWASYHDNHDAAALLLQAGADINAQTDNGVTPLWLAADNGSAAMTRLLLETGADPGAQLITGETALVTAALAGNADTVELLLQAGADPNTVLTRGQTALMWAANQGHAGIVAALLRHGADVNARTETRRQYVKTEQPQDSNPAYKTWMDDGGYTPLMFAARAGDLDSARFLVDAGSDLNAESAIGYSPLVMAVHGGNADLVSYLLGAGAKPDSAAGGHTALHAAVLRGDRLSVQALLNHDADTEIRVSRATPVRRQSTDYHLHPAFTGATALWLAARFSEPAIMELLIAAGADARVTTHVNYPAERNLAESYHEDEGEISVLMAAAGMGHRRATVSWGSTARRAGIVEQDSEALILAACRLAVDAGAELNLRNAAGQTALAYAKTRRYPSVVGFLETAGATE